MASSAIEGVCVMEDPNANNDSKRAIASRRNGAKSKGPKTPEGKAISSLNALKHGLLSNLVVVPGLESKADFEKLYEDLRIDLLPVGRTQEVLVEKIAVYYWRWRRAVAAEQGEINNLGPFPPQDPLRREADEEQILVDERQLELLNAALGEVEEHGYLESNFITQLYAQFWEDRMWVEHLDTHNRAALINLSRLKPSEAVGAEEHARTCPNSVEQMLQEMANRLGALHRGRVVLFGTPRPSYLPHPEVVDRILRYETTIEKALYRALNQLERMQRHQGGELVMPMNFDINGDVIV
jgi:hypothetical protein